MSAPARPDAARAHLQPAARPVGHGARAAHRGRAQDPAAAQQPAPRRRAVPARRERERERDGRRLAAHRLEQHDRDDARGDPHARGRPRLNTATACWRRARSERKASQRARLRASGSIIATAISAHDPTQRRGRHPAAAGRRSRALHAPRASAGARGARARRAACRAATIARNITVSAIHASDARRAQPPVAASAR